MKLIMKHENYEWYREKIRKAVKSAKSEVISEIKTLVDDQEVVNVMVKMERQRILSAIKDYEKRLK